MELAQRIIGRLTALRLQENVSQRRLGREIGLSASSFSRLERGLCQLHLDQLVGWAAALGLRVEVVLWTPAGGCAGPAARVATPGDPENAVLTEVAAALPHLPPTVRRALVRRMREWKSEAAREPEPER